MPIGRFIGGASALALACALLAPASAQDSNSPPFSIKRPPDGATVREKVRVEVPLASIPENGYVAYSVDGQFIVALTPTDEQRAEAERVARRTHTTPVFTWVWDTKTPLKVRGSIEEVAPKDGPHTISATVYGPTPGATGSTAAARTSSVTVTVANKAHTDPGAITLRYRFPDGVNRVYDRTGSTAVVTGLTTGMSGTGDKELVAQNSKLLTEVQDVYGDGSAIVRNKLTQLTVRQNGQEQYFPAEQLPQSLYQQLSPTGHVLYQNETPSFEEFAQLGVPVDTTLELPKLPLDPKRIGDAWTTPDERLDIPGTPPDKQPRVTLTSTLEGIEWQGGYPTAKIHQTYDSSKGGLKDKTITFGTTEIENPTLKYTRDIYLAYRSGTLVRVDRKLEVTGRTTENFGQMGGGAPGMSGSPYGGPPGGMSGYPGGPPAGYQGMAGQGSPYGAGPGMMGRRGRGGAGGAGMGYPGGPPGGMGMYGQMMQRTRRGGSGGPPGGYPGMGAGMGYPGAPPSSGMRGPGYPGAPMGGMGANGAQANQQITLRSTTTTELEHPAGRAHVASSAHRTSRAAVRTHHRRHR